MEKTSFNSFLESDDYDLIKIDAIRKKVNLRDHISHILSDYAKVLKSKEQLSVEETTQ